MANEEKSFRLLDAATTDLLGLLAVGLPVAPGTAGKISVGDFLVQRFSSGLALDTGSGSVRIGGSLLEDATVDMDTFLLSWLNGTFRYGGPDSGQGIVAQIFEPSNYGQVYPSGTGSRFTTSWELFPGVNPDGRPNMVGNFWGYNVNPGGGQITPGEFSFRYGTETYFRQSGNYLSEHHLPEIIDNAGGFHRLWSMYIVRASGYTFLQSQINSFEYFRFDDALNSYAAMYNEFDTGNTTFSLAARGGIFGPVPGGDGSGFAQLKLVGADLKEGYVRFGHDYSLSLIAANGPILINASTDVQMTDFVLFPFASSLFGGDSWVRFRTRVAGGGFKLDDQGTSPIADLTPDLATIYGVLVLPTRATPPVSPSAGAIYHDGTHIFCYLNSTWKQLDN